MILFPKVKSIKEKSKYFEYSHLHVVLDDELATLEDIIKSRLMKVAFHDEPNLVFKKDSSCQKEGYHLFINASGVQIDYIDYSGALYGLMTLVQIVSQYPKKLPYLAIEDYPDLTLRGVMIDIARDKIPTLETLKQMVDNLMMMKINHLQLYVEGFALEYPSYQSIQKDETPLTLSEYEDLERYCQIRGIDLVGNMNSFGHMTAWLAKEEFHSLAECENGFTQWGFPFPASTLNPLDASSFNFVKQLYNDFLPHSSSKYFNINCDEPFELGRGKSKELCDQIGVESVYLNFVTQLIDVVHQAKKTPMMWGDVLINHPDIAKKLPKDLIFIDWGYDRHYDFLNHARRLNELELSFVLAPGTSTWNSFTGRFTDMITTSKNAGINAKRYQGLGVLTTDWGDNGHFQYLPWSYIGFAYMSQVTWSDEYDDFEALSAFLDNAIYGEFSNKLTKAMIELSRYNDLETTYVNNGTTAFQSIMYVDPTERFPFEVRKNMHNQLIKQNPLSLDSLKKIKSALATFDATIHPLKIANPLLVLELNQTSNFIKLGILINAFVNYPEVVDEISIIKLIDSLIENHQKLWLLRNKEGGLSRSLSRLYVLRQFISMK